MKMPDPEEEEAKFAMAPMIDMVFLLLVFFMCTSTLSAKAGLKMMLPFASKGSVPKERPDRYVVNIMPDGSLFSGDDPITVDALKGAVKAYLAENPKSKVYLRADGTSPHRVVKKVMAAMAEAGVDDFIFGVYTPSESLQANK
jgi:biopolymer transport protein ExbD